MSKYDLGIIDGQYVLRRNMSIQASGGKKVNQNLLEKSFLQSMMKLKRDFDFDKIIICFDKRPYLKEQGVEEYKGDRHYENQDDVNAINEELMFESDPEKIQQLEDKLAETETKSYNNLISGKAKYDLIGNISELGFYCMMKKGWEADDLSFAVCEKCRQLDLSAILITSDKDWVSFRSKKIFYATPKGNTRLEHAKWLVGLCKSTQVPVYDIGILSELYGLSHNHAGAYEFSESVSLEEFIHKIYYKDSSLPGFDEYYKRYNAFNMRNYLPDIENYVNFTLSRTDKGNFYTWSKFCSERQINLPYGQYAKFLKDCNKDYIHAGQDNESVSIQWPDT